jgi:SAM-dependent methyltransferase
MRFRRQIIRSKEDVPEVRLATLSADDILRISYELLLRREPDPVGAATHIEALRSGERTPGQLVEWITSSSEFKAVNRRTELGPSIQESRSAFVRSLPRAARILDLGGTAMNMPEGAFVGALGYPYEFESLVIVDLPLTDRNEIYRDGAHNTVVDTPRGPVTYRYHSMTDLGDLESDSFDLVYLGQAIEHVSLSEADVVLQDVHRVLRHDGHLALDTPNSQITRLQQASFIDPDHKYEYSHFEMVEKLDKCGFHVIDQKGLNYAGLSSGQPGFSMGEVAGNPGMFYEIQSCYLLAYLCKPV